ncbi:glycerol-3-phosphate 1-O-acyltransferase [Rhodococcus qingshengii]|nr:glycerol-3-phosphate 1-O-acyltransferase [Rhodococcus qingshengii]
MLNILTLILSYLIGSISFALVIGKMFYKTDILGYGSGNLGATNTFRVLGKKAGAIVAIADLLKGTVACLLPHMFGSTVNPIICGLLAISGHVFPIFAGFKGGKAVATSTGVFLFLTPLGTLIGFVVFLFTLITSKYVSISSISLGLSAILMTSALAFEIVKYLGAACLVYLGIITLIKKAKKVEKPFVKNVKTSGSFRQALFIELLNPKTSLFFLAFLPQFVRSNGTPVTTQLLILGITFVLMSIIYTTLLSLITSVIGNKLSFKSTKSSKWFGKAVGMLYIGLGLRLALQTQE